MSNNSAFNPENQIESIDSRIVVAMERLSETFRVLLWQEAKVLHLSPIQIQILIFLSFHRPEKRKVGYLAQEFNMTKATISDAVKVLEQKLLLRREPEPDDNRSHTLHLTETGGQIADQTANFALPLVQSLHVLTTFQKEVLLESLMLMMQRLQRANIISLQRMCFNCRFYQKTAQGHHCRFLDKSLTVNELRVDCPEFETAELSP